VLAAGAGVPVIRADWRFGSAIYDADGEARADAGTALRRTVLTAEVHAWAASTPYRRAGDVLGWLALASVCSLLLVRIGRSRARKPQPAVAGGVAD
jgi:apolipoprotein N-acyltransferase